MTSLDDLLEKAETVGNRLVDAGESRFAEVVRPKLRDLVVRGTQLKLRQARGEDIGTAGIAIESQLSNLGVQERLWVVQTQFDLALQVVVELLDAAA
jgi:hypothetical protein